MEQREQRKKEHIAHALRLSDGPLSPYFACVHVVPEAVPALAQAQVCLETVVAGLVLPQPFYLNAITGGAKSVTKVNHDLASVAAAAQCAMAVGSEYGAVCGRGDKESLRIVRKVNPKGIVFANMSAAATVSEAQEAVDLVEAQLLQIHLNAAQELAMAEGDRDFTQWLTNIEQIVLHVSVPVCVKETGCGMGRNSVRRLYEAGVRIVDVSGAGGTNFPRIEAARAGRESCLMWWGLPTALSLIEAQSLKLPDLTILASGGVRSALDALKALCLGASAVGMAGNVLRLVTTKGVESAVKELVTMQEELRDLILLTGCENIKQLRNVPLYYTGELYEALSAERR